MCVAIPVAAVSLQSSQLHRPRRRGGPWDMARMVGLEFVYEIAERSLVDTQSCVASSARIFVGLYKATWILSEMTDNLERERERERERLRRLILL